jgi:glycosyltransferase involved in cell wall biosynthesis
MGRALADPSVHLAIVSCGPPHFVHRAAASIARDSGLPFVMDMRDPWSLIQRLPEPLASPVTLALAARGERRAVTCASLVVMNTEPARDAMRLCYPGAAERIIAVPNGHDDDPVPVLDRDSRFVVGYAGTIYLDRNPRTLFRAAAEFVRRTGVRPEAFSVEFMGDVASLDGVPLDQIACEEGVGEFVRIHAAVPRREALEFLARASMLVVLPQDSDMAIPAKVFEYMRFPAWLLVFAASTSATAQLLDGVDAHVIAPDDVDGIASALEARFRDHMRGVQATPLAAHAYLGRRARAATLFGALETVSVAHSARTVESRAMIIPITKYRYGP